MIVLFLHILLALPLVAAVEPMMAETKAQVELENVLSRLISREEFLLQVSTEVKQEQQRRLVEGESFIMPSAPSRNRVTPMPGFIPEPDVTEPKPPAPPERRIYRVYDVPVLKALRVRVDFDDGVSANTIARAKTLVKDYLISNFGGIATASFARMPMRESPQRMR